MQSFLTLPLSVPAVCGFQGVSLLSSTLAQGVEVARLLTCKSRLLGQRHLLLVQTAEAGLGVVGSDAGGTI